MKNIKNFKINLLSILLGFLVLASCQQDELLESATDQSTIEKPSSKGVLTARTISEKTSLL